MTTNFQVRARREDSNGHMTVQEMVYELRDAFDAFAAKFDAGHATVAQTNTTVDVTITQAIADYAVEITPTLDPGGRYWVSNKTSTGFRINLQTAAPAGGIPFDWLVKEV